MKSLLQKILCLLAKAIIKTHQPIVIGVTGSVGKTGTVEAIYQVLKNKFNVRKSYENYNNEIGLPLTIIGRKSAGKSIFGWLGIFYAGWKLKSKKADYPKILILEMGVDKPRDMDYLLSIVKPNISVITYIGQMPVHVEFFKSPKELAEEKIKIIQHLKTTDTAILNYDDLPIRLSQKQTHAKTLTYGFIKGAEILAQSLNLNPDLISGQLQGYSFKMRYQGKEIPVRLKNIFSKSQIYTVLAAAAVALDLKMNMVEISQNLFNFKAPKGRTNLILGIKKTYLIDDSYNSSPSACIAALDVLKEFKVNGQKIACLGDMLELGTLTIPAHQDIGKAAAMSADILVTVGQASQYIASEAVKFGFPQDKVYQFQDSKIAGKFIQNKILKPNDLVLIKGSQGVRMEKITKELMAEPEKANKLLVRQTPEWLKK